MTQLVIKMFILVAAFLALTAVEVNGQPSSLITSNFRNFINYDVNAAVTALSSQTVLNNFICMYMCTSNPNCALVVFKSSNLCNVYSSSAVSQVVATSTGSWLYQMQISGLIFVNM
jgi:hypothetical protein